VRLPALLTALLVLVLVASLRSAWADGQLPALPYRYLRPPPALAATNQPPTSDIHVVPADYLRALGFGTYTKDTQAGISAGKGAFQLDSGATAVEIHITPVETPPGLPAALMVDGNAYRVTALEQPSGKAATLTGPLNVILRWPHIPVAIYIQPAGSSAWRQVCYEDTAILTASTIGCPIHSLGIVAAVTTRTTTITYPRTPARQLNPYIPILLAIILLVAAVVLGYIVSRPRKRPEEGPPQ